MEIVYGIVAVIILWFILTYNSLVRGITYIDEAYSQIDVQLQRRNDLIPVLVNTLKGYTKHESSTLEAVIKARQQLIDLPSDASPQQVNSLANQLSGSLSRLLIVVEDYPRLKAIKGFDRLQEELVSSENKISAARSYYNKLIALHNNKVKMVPTNIVAKMVGYQVKDYLKTPEDERVVPEVSF